MRGIRRSLAALALGALLLTGCSDEEGAGGSSQASAAPSSGGQQASGGLGMPTRGDPLVGSFVGRFLNKPTELHVKAEGDKLVGEFDVGGYAYDLSAGRTTVGATGTLNDGNTGGTMPITLTPNGDGMKVTLQMPNQSQPSEVVLARMGGPADSPAMPPTANVGGPLGPGTPPPPATPTVPTPTAATPGTDPLAGEFSGNFQGTPTKMTLVRQGEQVNGTMVGGGATYQITARGTGNSARGTVTGPDIQGSLNCDLVGDGNRVTVTVHGFNPQTGQPVALPVVFTRGQAAVAGTPSPAADGERDPALVGRWRYTETHSSGTFTMASDTWMTLAADGQYRYGDTKMAGGGDAGSFEGGGGGAETGQWKTANRRIYVKSAGDAAWTDYASYYVEGDSLMFTFSNGKKQIWYRR